MTTQITVVQEITEVQNQNISKLQFDLNVKNMQEYPVYKTMWLISPNMTKLFSSFVYLRSHI